MPSFFASAATALVVTNACHSDPGQSSCNSVEDVETLTRNILVTVQRATAVNHEYNWERTCSVRQTESGGDLVVGGQKVKLSFRHIS